MLKVHRTSDAAVTGVNLRIHVTNSGYYPLKSQSDRQAPAACCCGANVNRRLVVGGIVGIAAAPALAQGDAPNAEVASAPPQEGDYLVRASGDDQITPLTPEDITPNSAPLQAWPADSATQTVRNGSYLNLLVLTRWDPAVLSPEGQEYAAGGVVAQSAICTHEGCEVTGWVAESFWMECPCHLSRFDPRQNGAVMQGPAVRKLPALKLKLEEDKIVVAAAFDGRVGGG